MEQSQPAGEDDKRAVARRLFKALCELYPDRYIALIERRDIPSDRPPLELPTVNAPAL